MDFATDFRINSTDKGYAIEESYMGSPWAFCERTATGRVKYYRSMVAAEKAYYRVRKNHRGLVFVGAA